MDIKSKAITLRKKGFSYGQIKKQLGISKSTCSLWLRAVKLGKRASLRLKVREFRGKKQALQTIRKKIKDRDAKIFSSVSVGVNKIKINQQLFKLLCAFLYWGEGEKSGRSVSFTNSDPLMIQTYVKLLKQSFGVKTKNLKALLHLHSYHKKRKQIKFWSKITGIPKSNFSVYNKPNTGKVLRQGYPGCIAVRVYDVKILRELQFYYKYFAEKYGGLV